MEVLIGVDPHKATNAAVAIEGATGIGRPLAQKLTTSGEEVVDVPPKLSARVRVLSTSNASKNDRLDATFTALAALRNERLARVHPEDGLEGRVEILRLLILRLLTERREDLVAERTRVLNRLHVLLRDLLSEGVAKGLSAEAAAKLLRRARPNHAAGRTRKWLASELVRDVRALDRKVALLDERIREEVEASDTTLTEVFGIGSDSGGEDRRDRGRRREVPEQGALRLLRRRRSHRSL